ncbi:MAG: hypothetical protein ABSB10_03535 [Candidatus Bathyarchaeia archaeon]|jgi:hypothetical protein
MATTKDSELGICYECSTKDMDSSKKIVYHCDICNKWFCELHLKPKFPYFVDWETVFDVQGNPEVKALFYSEYRREEGHPDFEYLRKIIESLQLEERFRNKLIQQAIDRMIEANQKRNAISMKKLKMAMKGDTKTYENKFGHDFTVPLEVYEDDKYRIRLNNANLLSEVETIVADYYRHHSKESKEEKPKKKHWWQ